MMTIPWKDVQNDIKNALYGYDCKITKVEQSENPDGSVFCDFRVTFKNPDDVADWDEVLTMLDSRTGRAQHLCGHSFPTPV